MTYKVFGGTLSLTQSVIHIRYTIHSSNNICTYQLLMPHVDNEAEWNILILRRAT